MKTVLLSYILLFSVILVQEKQFPESDAAMYKAYLGQDIANLKEQWKKIVASRESKAPSGGKDILYAAALARFGLLSATMRDQDEDLFDAYADDTEEMLESLHDENKKWGEPRALLSAVYGLKMGYSPIKGMFLGPKSQALMEQALKDAPDSPLVWKLYANSKFFTPETWGGDLSEAIKGYEKSIRLYETNSAQTKENWFYLDTLAFLGQAYLKKGQPAQAIAVYEKALKVEPEFTWVKFKLLPAAKKNLASN
jgi:tetratricopeptide (TPR) repeat protein